MLPSVSQTFRYAIYHMPIMCAVIWLIIAQSVYSVRLHFTAFSAARNRNALDTCFGRRRFLKIVCAAVRPGLVDALQAPANAVALQQRYFHIVEAAQENNRMTVTPSW